MEDTKPWWQSRTIWASVLQVALGVAVSFGLITDAQSGAILADAPDLILGIRIGPIALGRMDLRRADLGLGNRDMKARG